MYGPFERAASSLYMASTTQLAGLFGPGYKDELVGYGSSETFVDNHGGDLTAQLALVVIFPVAVTFFFLQDRD